MQVSVKRLEEKTDKLEKALQELTEHMKALAYQALKTERELLEFKEEMREFREEMRAYREQKEREMQEFREEWRAYREQKEREMQEFREEWRAYREQKERELREYKEYVDKQINEMNKKWGDLVNKWGTMVEDIIIPGIPFALKRRFGLEVKKILASPLSRKDGKEREYDAIVIAGDYVFVFSVKSRFKVKHFEEVEEALRDFFEFFPEYQNYRLVPVIAAFNFDEGTINKATKKGYLVLQMSGDYLDFINADKVKLP
ncbi:MAG: hypothetical protein ACP5IN_05720 [Caldimicrobium sp.]